MDNNYTPRQRKETAHNELHVPLPTGPNHTEGDMKVERALIRVLEDSGEDFSTDVDFVYAHDGLKALTYDVDGFVNATYQVKIEVTQIGGVTARVES